ncbi:MAG TPA: glycosyltransferase family 2 protein [Acidimicrobiales bacterium]|nr:glycosyltransferase family 2 protein [Acidimicrobiales bacterium]
MTHTDVAPRRAQRQGPPSVSVVVCCYTFDRWAQVRRAVESLRAQQPAPAEVIVVVDHNDELLAAVRAAAPAGVRIVDNTRAKGLAGARNAGTAAASGDVVAFLDDDAWVAPGWLAGMLAAYRDPAVVGVGGDVAPEWPGGARPGWFPAAFDWVVGCSYEGLPTAPAPVRNFIGANMSFRRDALEAVGGFSEGVGRSATAPLGCEETELSIRVAGIAPGTVLRYDPAVQVHHTVSPERTRPGYFLRRCLAEGLSKAVIAGMVGAGAATSTERTYVRVVLAGAARRAVADVAHGDRSGLGRLAALCGGLAATATGFAAGRAGMGRVVLRAVERRRPPSPAAVVAP